MRVVDFEKSGLNIRDMRKSKGLSIQTTAKYIGVSIQAIYRWERGETFPDINNLIALADFLGTSINDLVATKEADIKPENWLRNYMNEPERRRDI